MIDAYLEPASGGDISAVAAGAAGPSDLTPTELPLR